MNRLPGVIGVLLVLVLSMGFAALNGGQRITLRLGFITLYAVPLTLVVFSALILGMLVMLLAGVRSDLRVRRILRDRLAREDEEERARMFVDRNQQDLFEEVPPAPAGGPDGAAAPAKPPPGPSATRPPLRIERGHPREAERMEGAGRVEPLERVERADARERGADASMDDRSGGVPPEEGRPT